MIFCFSGTGNSRYVAEKIAYETEDVIIDITKEEIEKDAEYVLKKGERLGFVYPIYWWGMPVLVEEFIRKAEIKAEHDNYIYGVSTYGMEPHNGLKDLEKMLIKKGMHLQAVFEVKMVDNYVVGYELADKEKRDNVNKQADIKIKDIVDNIVSQRHIKITDVLGTTIKPIVHKFYKCKDHRKKFYVTDECTGCGLCANNCPCKAIVMEENKPVWKENCSFCLKCINSCPKRALQYGKGTQNRTRYLKSME